MPYNLEWYSTKVQHLRHIKKSVTLKLNSNEIIEQYNGGENLQLML